MGLRSVLYISEGAEVILTSYLWAEAGLHNGAKGKVIAFVYQYDNVPINGDFTEAVVVQFRELQEDIQPFLPNIPRTISIPVISVEWRNYNGKNCDGVLILKQVLLMLTWYFMIHKYQGKTLYCAVINLGKSEKYSGMTLVALSFVRKIIHFLLKTFSCEK